MREPPPKPEPFRRGAITVKVRGTHAGRKLLQAFVRDARARGLLAAARLEEVFPDATPGDKFAGLWTIELDGAIDTVTRMLRTVDGVEMAHEAPQRRAVAG